MPLILLGALQLLRRRVPDLQRRRMYFASAALILIGVLAMRWNVVIGGQLFSKSLRGVMSYKMEFAGLEGWFMGARAPVLAIRHPDGDDQAVFVREAAERRRPGGAQRGSAVADGISGWAHPAVNSLSRRFGPWPGK